MMIITQIDFFQQVMMMLMEKRNSDRTLINNHPIKIIVNLLRASNDKVMAGKLGSFLVGLSLLLNRVKQKRVSSGKRKRKSKKQDQDQVQEQELKKKKPKSQTNLEITRMSPYRSKGQKFKHGFGLFPLFLLITWSPLED